MDESDLTHSQNQGVKNARVTRTDTLMDTGDRRHTSRDGAVVLALASAYRSVSVLYLNCRLIVGKGNAKTKCKGNQREPSVCRFIAKKKKKIQKRMHRKRYATSLSGNRTNPISLLGRDEHQPCAVSAGWQAESSVTLSSQGVNSEVLKKCPLIL